MNYFIQSYSCCLGAPIKYGVVYSSMSKAKKGLREVVVSSRKHAKSAGYGEVHPHYNDDKTFCRITFGKDENSSLWENLGIANCERGVPYDEMK